MASWLGQMATNYGVAKKNQCSLVKGKIDPSSDLVPVGVASF